MTERLYCLDKRSCYKPEDGWVQVLDGVPLSEVEAALHRGLFFPEVQPHVYRAYQVADDPGD